MADRMTEINLPGAWVGIAEHGRVDPEQMITQAREQAARDLAAAQAVLAAADEDFRITTYVGVHVQRELEVIQPGGASSADSRPHEDSPVTGQQGDTVAVPDGAAGRGWARGVIDAVETARRTVILPFGKQPSQLEVIVREAEEDALLDAVRQTVTDPRCVHGIALGDLCQWAEEHAGLVIDAWPDGEETQPDRDPVRGVELVWRDGRGYRCPECSLFVAEVRSTDPAYCPRCVRSTREVTSGG